MQQRAVLDRIVDGAHAVLLLGDEEREVVVPVNSLPSGTTEGTWLLVRFEGEQLVEAVADASETERVRRRVENKMQRLKARGRRRSP